MITSEASVIFRKTVRDKQLRLTRGLKIIVELNNVTHCSALQFCYFLMQSQVKEGFT